MLARLFPLDGGPPVGLVKDLTLIGRTEDCDLRIDHKSISKMHCILAVTDGLVVVRDLGSTNGTRVNGQKVRRGVLLPNDQFAVANFRYRLKLGADGDSPPSADAPTRLAERLDVEPAAADAESGEPTT